MLSHCFHFSVPIIAGSAPFTAKIHITKTQSGPKTASTTQIIQIDILHEMAARALKKKTIKPDQKNLSQPYWQVSMQFIDNSLGEWGLTFWGRGTL